MGIGWTATELDVSIAAPCGECNNGARLSSCRGMAEASGHFVGCATAGAAPTRQNETERFVCDEQRIFQDFFPGKSAL